VFAQAFSKRHCRRALQPSTPATRSNQAITGNPAAGSHEGPSSHACRSYRGWGIRSAGTHGPWQRPAAAAEPASDETPAVIRRLHVEGLGDARQISANRNTRFKRLSVASSSGAARQRDAAADHRLDSAPRKHLAHLHPWNRPRCVRPSSAIFRLILGMQVSLVR